MMSIWILFFLLLLVLQAVVFTGAIDSCESPCLYITNKTSVIRVALNKTTGLPAKKEQVLYTTRGHIRSIEIDAENKHIFWGDFKYNSINRSSLDGSNMTSLFTYGIGYPQGLAVDKSSNIIYWTDSLTNVIELSDTAGRNRKVLFKLDKDSEPRGIITNSKHGYLFWSDWGKRPRIEKSTLAGENRTEIVTTSLRWPNDLAIDHETQRLYWIDAHHDVVESVYFDGSGRRLEYKLTYHNKSVHPYSMAISKDRNTVYIADWFSDAVFAVNNVTKLLYNNSDKAKQVGQIRILQNITETTSKPCLSDKNNCSHLCLKTVNNKHVCACPTGMILKTKNICQETSREYEIYFADSYAKTVNHLIKYENEDGFKMQPLPIISNETLGYPVALDYDPIQKLIYWTDRITKKTYRMAENGNSFEVILKAKHGASFGLAVDKISKLLYWFTDDPIRNEKILMMSSLDGKYQRVILKNLGQPRDIALYEEKGYIYFTEYGYMFIGRINNDGSQFIDYSGSRLAKVSATGIAIDKTENRVYWCDSDHYSIASSDLNFKNKRTIIQKTVYRRGHFWLIENYGNVVNPFSISIFGEKVFWTDIYKRAIFSADKRGGDKIEYVTGGLDHPRDMHIYSDIPKTEYKNVYLFSYQTNFRNQVFCFGDGTCSSHNVLPVRKPRKCPYGYKQSNYGSICANVLDPVGARFRARCTNWMTCAQRAYSTFRGCRTRSKFVFFKVRECVQVVKPGICKYDALNACPRNQSCSSDNECNGTLKCCMSSCGRKCMLPIQQSDHPCLLNNGGCSHFCLAKSNSYKCACPNLMYIDSSGKLCKTDKIPISSDVCALPADHGPCHGPFANKTRWYFNEKSKKCESFVYGGCGGNRNNYPKETYCESQCGDHNLCANNPCKNGRTCTIVKDSLKCKCQESWHGPTCNISIDQYLVRAHFEKESRKTVTIKRFQETTAAAATKWCDKPTSKCKFVKPKRKRRDSQPAVLYKFMPEDIYVGDFHDGDDTVVVSFAVAKVDRNDGAISFLDKSSIDTILEEYNNDFKNALKLDYQGLYDPVTVPHKESSRKATKISIAVVFIVLILVVIVFAYWYIRKRKTVKKPNNAGNGGTGGVHWSFENQLYDDLYPNNVSLPPIGNDEEKNTSFANPAHITPGEDPQVQLGAVGSYAVPEEVEKKISLDWVTFENETKEPVTDFVEAQFGDSYDTEEILNQPPPEYTSRAGTPAPSNREDPTISFTKIPDLPDYQVATPGLTDIPGDQTTVTMTPRQQAYTPDENEAVSKQINVSGNTNC